MGEEIVKRQGPQMKTAAAFVCTSNTCSAPIFKADAIRTKVDKLTGKEEAQN